MVEYWKDMTTPQFEGEIWKDVPGFEGYQASNLGRVKSFVQNKNGRILKTNLQEGYQRVSLAKDKTYKSYGVHQLVMLTFIGDCPKGKEIDHINTIRNDNRLVNLRYCTRKENLHNPITLQRIVTANKNPKFKHKAVIQVFDDMSIKQWDSIANASKVLGLTPALIRLCIKGRIKQAGGFKWQYA